MMLLSNNRLRSLVFAMLIMFVIFTKFVNLKLNFTIEHSLVIIIIFWSVDNETTNICCISQALQHKYTKQLIRLWNHMKFIGILWTIYLVIYIFFDTYINEASKALLKTCNEITHRLSNRIV